jgi:uncharacterized RDD family membrane protein YckC
MNPILDAPVIAEQKLQYAGFWIRFVAVIIDGIILWIVNMVLSMVLLGGSLGLGAMSGGEDYGAFGAMIALYYVVSLGIGVTYFALLESSARQATLGKMAVGIKVGDENGGRISGLNAVGRYFAKILSGIILCIGYIMAGFDPKKQALHDKIAGTVVYYA